MHRFSSIVIPLFAALVLTSASAVYAESAPVFDLDAMQDQGQYNADDGQDIPPPPPESGFVPAQTYGQSESAPAPKRAPSSSTSAVDQRIKRMEEEIKTLRNSESTAHAEVLQNEVQTLRDQVEQLTHQLDQMKKKKMEAANQIESDGLIADNAALNDDEEAPAPTPPKGVKASASKATAKAGAIAAETKEDASPKVTPKTTVASETKPDSSASDGQPNVAEEQQIYQTAYNLIKEKKYADAADVLQGMLKKYPSGQFASNAHYWLGELYVLMDKNDLALKEFTTVVENYARSPRISDAQLKIGIIYAAQANWTNAKDSFKKVINHYPGTASSRIASEQLKQLKQAGH